MSDAECVQFLQWALPRLGLRWAGFRRVRRQVCRRLRKRLDQLGLEDLAAYRHYLAERPAEWQRLAPLCRVTISRFYRDREVWRGLGEVVVPALARWAAAAGRSLAVWSAGCGAGEEPYTLAILAQRVPLPPAVELSIVATDIDRHQLERARRAEYPASSLVDLPAEWRQAAFEELHPDRWRLRASYRARVELRFQDLQRECPDEAFALILCRNLAFTYFDEASQQRALGRLLSRLEPGGALVVGCHEAPPADADRLAPWPGCRGVWRSSPGPGASGARPDGDASTVAESFR